MDKLNVQEVKISIWLSCLQCMSSLRTSEPLSKRTVFSALHLLQIWLYWHLNSVISTEGLVLEIQPLRKRPHFYHLAIVLTTITGTTSGNWGWSVFEVGGRFVLKGRMLKDRQGSLLISKLGFFIKADFRGLGFL